MPAAEKTNHQMSARNPFSTTNTNTDGGPTTTSTTPLAYHLLPPSVLETETEEADAQVQVYTEDEHVYTED